MSLRDAVGGQDTTTGPRLQIRVGVNLGPVRLVKDINGSRTSSATESTSRSAS